MLKPTEGSQNVEEEQKDNKTLFGDKSVNLSQLIKEVSEQYNIDPVKDVTPKKKELNLTDLIEENAKNIQTIRSIDSGLSLSQFLRDSGNIPNQKAEEDDDEPFDSNVNLDDLLKKNGITNNNSTLFKAPSKPAPLETRMSLSTLLDNYDSDQVSFLSVFKSLFCKKKNKPPPNEPKLDTPRQVNLSELMRENEADEEVQDVRYIS